MLFFFKACLMFQFRKKSDRSWLLENFVSKCEKTKQIGCRKKNLFWNYRIKGFLVIYVFRFQLSIEHVFNNDAIYIVLLEQERHFKRSVALLEFLVVVFFCWSFKHVKSRALMNFFCKLSGFISIGSINLGLLGIRRRLTLNYA